MIYDLFADFFENGSQDNIPLCGSFQTTDEISAVPESICVVAFRIFRLIFMRWLLLF